MRRTAFAWLGSVAMALVVWSAVQTFAQSTSVQRVGDAVAVRAPTFTFIKGEPLLRLKDGRSVRVDLDLGILPGPGGQPTAQIRQIYVLSYDLWEERFAVTQVGVPSRSISHRTAAAAEAWCLEQLTVPIAALGTLGRDRPFWIRLDYRVVDDAAASTSHDDDSFSLRGLIDALSRRRRETAWSHSIEAGPFRLGS